MKRLSATVTAIALLSCVGLALADNGTRSPGARRGAGTAIANSSAPTVLDFPDTQTTNVDLGFMAGWTPGTDIGSGYWWEGWAALRKGGYLLANGGSGAHALLFGLAADPGTTGSAFTGNVYDGTGATSYGTDPTTAFVAAGEWFHFATAWDGSYLRVYINGILSGLVPFAGPRRCLDGDLGVMGSTHSNSSGRVAWIRGYDTALPYGTTTINDGYPNLAFIPERWPRSQILSNSGVGTTGEADLILDFMSPGALIPDRSRGYGGATHPGRRYAFTPGGTALMGGILPTWVQDATCPLVSGTSYPLQTESIIARPTTPAGALVFDSFSRRNQTYALQTAPTLGSTEAGSRGPLAWNVPVATGTNANPYGILSGRAVFVGDASSLTVPAWVSDVGTADMDVRVDRSVGGYNQYPLITLSGPGIKSSQVTGLVFRVQDANNYWYVGMGQSHFVIGYVLAGVRTDVDTSIVRSGYTSGTVDDFTTLRLVAKGTAITLHTSHADGTNDVVQGTWTDSTLQTARGAGVGQTGQYLTDMTSLWRADNFTVFAAP